VEGGADDEVAVTEVAALLLILLAACLAQSCAGTGCDQGAVPGPRSSFDEQWGRIMQGMETGKRIESAPLPENWLEELEAADP
jgi:hypothetical protein